VQLGATRTREDGTFRIDWLARGVHDLVIGSGLLPAEDALRRSPRLGPGTSVDLGTFTLPARIRVTTIRGVVLDHAGAPVTGARLQIAEVGQDPSFAAAVTDTRGRYVFAAVPGRRYVVSLDTFRADAVSDTPPETIVAGTVAGPGPIRLRTPR
jgi:hypothetical protein